MQLAPHRRNLALPQLELLELDEHLVQVEEALGRHEFLIGRSRFELEG